MLSWPSVHLLVNHFPVVLAVLGLAAAIAAWIFRRRALWLYAMGTLTVAGVIVYPVHCTGDEAAHALRGAWYIVPGAIDAHDSVAGIAVVVIILTGLVSVYGWWRAVRHPAETIPIWVRVAVLVGAVASAATVAYTAYLGGKIVHDAPVLRAPVAPAGVLQGVPGVPPGDSMP